MLKQLGIGFLVFWVCLAGAAESESLPEVWVVYWGSADCRWCAYWESSSSGLEADFRAGSAFKKIRFVTIKNARTADPYVESDVPREGAWLWERAKRGAFRLPKLRPAWSIFLGDKHLRTYIGAYSWKDTAFPAIQKLTTARDESPEKLTRVLTEMFPGASGDKVAVTDVEAVPYIGSSGREAYTKWLQKKEPKAFAIAPDGSYGWARATVDALTYCRRYAKDDCELYAVDGQVVWGRNAE